MGPIAGLNVPPNTHGWFYPGLALRRIQGVGTLCAQLPEVSGTKRERGFFLMSFIESIRTVLSKYAVFSGRARRSEYWWFALAYTIVLTILYFVLIVPGLTAYSTAVMEYTAAADAAAPMPTMPGSVMTGYLIVSLVALALFLPSLGVVVRRLHDTDRSGFWIFFSLVPFVGSIMLIVWEATAGTPGPNRFGPDPKAVEQTAAV
jgi:uncharacterized membrane protein YhaH (DUF805 family)